MFRVVDGQQVLQKPVYNRFLRKCRVRRTSAFVEVDYSLTEDGSKRIMFEGARILTDSDQRESTIELKPTFVPLALALFAVKPDGQVIPLGPDVDNQPIPPGHYTATVRVLASEHTIASRRRLLVGSGQSGTYWLS